MSFLFNNKTEKLSKLYVLGCIYKNQESILNIRLENHISSISLRTDRQKRGSLNSFALLLKQLYLQLSIKGLGCNYGYKYIRVYIILKTYFPSIYLSHALNCVYTCHYTQFSIFWHTFLINK